MDLLSYLGLAINCYYAFIAIPGLLQVEFLKDVPRVATPKEPASWPLISVIIAACNEEHRISATVLALLAADYPRLEIIAVNDRSSDQTGTILHALQRQHARVRVLDITQLPDGWLGKTHALQRGYELAHGDWLCFTDADVVMHKATLSTAFSIARERQLDHLSLYPEFETAGFYEKLFIITTWFFFILHAQPWAAKDSRSTRYCGVGAFNFIRREAYEAIGTHERLRYELLDDMKLAKLVKASGYRQDALNGRGYLKLRWQYGGLKSYVLGIEKNAFAGLDFKLSILLGASICILFGNILPAVWLFVLSGPGQWAAVLAIALLTGIHSMLKSHCGLNTAWVLLQPLGCAIMLFSLWRSAGLAISRNAVEWRGTRYPLDELRKHLI
jgi:glycosyltransferase involved in cell wall biosynthesis